MLLVDDDEPDVGQRREDGQPRADDEVHVARPDPPPLVGPLARPDGRVDQRDPGVEVGPQPVDERQRQRDLGHQHERRPAGIETGGDRLDVDGRLAAAGDPSRSSGVGSRAAIAAPIRPTASACGPVSSRRGGTAAASSGGPVGKRPARPLAGLDGREPRRTSPASADVPWRPASRAAGSPVAGPSASSASRATWRGPSGRPAGRPPERSVALAARPASVGSAQRS